jgi:ABC-type transporter Mla subunit MlaD
MSCENNNSSIDSDNETLITIDTEVIDTYLEKFRKQKMRYIEYLREVNQLTDEKEQEVNDLLENIDTFIDELDDKETYALIIAIEHLEDSFDIERCIMFNKKY